MPHEVTMDIRENKMWDVKMRNVVLQLKLDMREN